MTDTLWCIFATVMLPVVFWAIYEDCRPHPEIKKHDELTRMAATLRWEARWLKYFRGAQNRDQSSQIRR